MSSESSPQDIIERYYLQRYDHPSSSPTLSGGKALIIVGYPVELKEWTPPPQPRAPPPQPRAPDDGDDEMLFARSSSSAAGSSATASSSAVTASRAPPPTPDDGDAEMLFARSSSSAAGSQSEPQQATTKTYYDEISPERALTLLKRLMETAVEKLSKDDQIYVIGKHWMAVQKMLKSSLTPIYFLHDNIHFVVTPHRTQEETSITRPNWADNHKRSPYSDFYTKHIQSISEATPVYTICVDPRLTAVNGVLDLMGTMFYQTLKNRFWATFKTAEDISNYIEGTTGDRNGIVFQDLSHFHSSTSRRTTQLTPAERTTTEAFLEHLKHVEAALRHGHAFKVTETGDYHHREPSSHGDETTSGSTGGGASSSRSGGGVP